MTAEQPPPHRRALTESQQTRREFGRRDYETARAADLAQLPEAGLILMIERLRGRLGDALDLVDELAEKLAGRSK